MPRFTYKARDKKGSLVEGVIEAEERAHVTARLQQMGYFPVSITAGGARPAAAGAAKGGGGGGSLSRILPKLSGGDGGAATKERTPKPKASSTRSQINVPKASARTTKLNTPKINGSQTNVSKLNVPVTPAMKDKAEKAEVKKPARAAVPREPMFQRRKVKTADIASFNRQMADLLGSGVPLVKALSILQKQTESENLREIIATINSDVSGGLTFADALARHPREFSKLYCAMVRSGEAGGMLDEVLTRLADFSEQEEQLKGRVKSALAYPLVMTIAGAGAVFFLFSYVVPKIIGTFAELNQTLPPMTKLLIDISTFTQNYWYIILGAVFAAAFGAWQFVRSPEGKLIWNRLQLRLPLFGDVVRKREVARFSRTLGSLLRNGVSILQALQITREVVNNELVRQEVEKVQEEITQGAGIAEPLRNSLVFPPVTVNMMAVGEETGNLQGVLLRISESYEMEVDRKIRTLTSLIEPLIIVLMAIVVGFIVISIMLPIFSMDPTGGV